MGWPPQIDWFSYPPNKYGEKIVLIGQKNCRANFFSIEAAWIRVFFKGMFQSSGLWQLKGINEFRQRVEKWPQNGQRLVHTDQVFVELCILTQKKLEKVKHETMKEMIVRKSPGLETCPTSGKEWLLFGKKTQKILFLPSGDLMNLMVSYWWEIISEAIYWSFFLLKFQDANLKVYVGDFPSQKNKWFMSSWWWRFENSG